jgi:hypothetical protein
LKQIVIVLGPPKVNAGNSGKRPLKHLASDGTGGENITNANRVSFVEIEIKDPRNRDFPFAQKLQG